MKLIDLKARPWAAEGRIGQGIVFLCPHCHSTSKPTWLCVAFANPLDGGEPFPIRKIGQLLDLLYGGGFIERGFPICPPGFLWTRDGGSLEKLSIAPSVDASPAGCWHGFITNGEIR